MTSCSRFDSAVETGAIGRDPYPLYRYLRENEPAAWSHQWNSWLVSRYDDILSVIKDPKRFSNKGRVVAGVRRDFPKEADGEFHPLVGHYSQGLINSDPPDHSRLRRLVQAAFLPKTVQALAPRIEALVDNLLDSCEAGGEIDFVRQFAYPLPITVIAELLGIPPEMRHQFKEWSGRIIQFQATPRPGRDVLRGSQQALLELREYFRSIFRARRERPEEDLISELVNVHLEGERLTEEELLSTCVTLLIGGHETTTSLLASGVYLLHRYPEIRGQLASGAGSASAFVEECLRYEPPFQRIVRVVMEDTELLGNPVQKGEMVVLLLGAGNRDETIFKDAESFIPQREPNRHLAFGAGPHFCLGAGISRLEAPIAFCRLVARFPHFQVEVEEPNWNDGMVRSLSHLPLRLR